VWRHRRRIPTRDRVFQFVASAGLGAVLVHALGDFPLQIASIQLYAAVLIGALWSCHRWLGDRTEPAHSTP
jgi:hypothetical protein